MRVMILRRKSRLVWLRTMRRAVPVKTGRLLFPIMLTAGELDRAYREMNPSEFDRLLLNRPISVARRQPHGA